MGYMGVVGKREEEEGNSLFQIDKQLPRIIRIFRLLNGAYPKKTNIKNLGFLLQDG